MKLLLLSLFLFGAGAGGYSLTTDAVEVPAPQGLEAMAEMECPQTGGRVTVECTGPDTCLVTCFDENEEVRCQEEISCDDPELPCESVCETARSCSR